jgi:exodeoxyribonuclease-1
MTRALRPEGIEWPVDSDGKAVNKLEPIAKVNHISHENAHDALSDVNALIDVTRLIRSKQPQLFEYLLKLRDKKEVQKLINLDDKEPFVYTSGRFDGQYAKTTVAFPIAPAQNNNVLVYDLRDDPTQFMSLSEDELAAKVFAPWEERSQEGFVRLPVKVLQYNRCPAVAPLGVLEAGEGWKRIGLDLETLEAHKKVLLSRPDFAERLRSVFERTREYAASSDPEAQLYDGFLADRDRLRVEAVRVANERELVDMHPDFSDERLPALLLHYKARNFPKSLSEDEVGQWEAWRAQRIGDALPRYLAALEKISSTTNDNEKQFLVQELQLWAESIIPVPD